MKKTKSRSLFGHKFLAFVSLIALLVILTQIKVPQVAGAELTPLPEKYKDYVKVEDINGVSQGVYYDDGHGDIDLLPLEYQVILMPNFEGMLLKASEVGIDVAGCATDYIHRFEVRVVIANNLPEPTKAMLKIVVSDVNEKAVFDTRLLPIELIPGEKTTVNAKFSISVAASDITYHIKVYIPTSEDLGSNPDAIKYVSLLESFFTNLGILKH